MRLISILLLASTLSACFWNKKEPTPQEEVSSESFVRLVYVGSNGEEGNRGLGVIPDAELYSENLAQECGWEKSGERALVDVVFAIIAKEAIKLIIDEVNKDLQALLDGYEAEYSASVTEQSLRTGCWRLTRGTVVSSDEGTSESVDFDLLFKIHQDAKSLSIEPLRTVYINPAPQYPSSNDIYGIAVSLKLMGYQGDSFITAFDGLIMKQDADLSDKEPPAEGLPSVPREYVLSYPATANSALACSPEKKQVSPMSCSTAVASTVSYGDRVRASAPMKMTVSIAEVGVSNGAIKFLAKVLDNSAEDIGGALADVAGDIIDPPEE